MKTRPPGFTPRTRRSSARRVAESRVSSLDARTDIGSENLAAELGQSIRQHSVSATGVRDALPGEPSGRLPDVREEVADTLRRRFAPGAVGVVVEQLPLAA